MPQQHSITQDTGRATYSPVKMATGSQMGESRESCIVMLIGSGIHLYTVKV